MSLVRAWKAPGRRETQSTLWHKAPDCMSHKHFLLCNLPTGSQICFGSCHYKGNATKANCEKTASGMSGMSTVLKRRVFVPHTLSSAGQCLFSSAIRCLHRSPSTSCPTGAVPDPHITAGQYRIFMPALSVGSAQPQLESKPQQGIANERLYSCGSTDGQMYVHMCR